MNVHSIALRDRELGIFGGYNHLASSLFLWFKSFFFFHRDAADPVLCERGSSRPTYLDTDRL